MSEFSLSLERSYACDEIGCEYRAAQAGHLTAHMRTHSAAGPYACDEIGKLKRHKRTLVSAAA
ncbi:hypothetical protein T492DRAFT_869970 [Pavlovales sp. CCMP2436]|nr:hypothetical protein T492DRAFT_869970 [Pavlovales sp. CCMP2436]